MNGRDDIHWYPMRVTYARSLPLKHFLDTEGIENFVPMRYDWVEDFRGKHFRLKPAVENLIFIHSSQAEITNLKMTRQACVNLRYMMRKNGTGSKVSSEIMQVPDRQMENFIRVASILDERVMFLDDPNFTFRPGTKVQVTEGPFAGVCGYVKQIKRQKRVVVQLDGIAAVAITFVPSKYLLKIND